MPNKPITDPEAQQLLLEELKNLKGTTVEYLKLPKEVIRDIEPSQVGTIVGTIVDASLPQIALEKNVGLFKENGILKDREGYPDFKHSSGYRVELKGLFKPNPDVELKVTSTPREPSSRLTQKVTIKNVDPDRDALLLAVYQMEKNDDDTYSPTIVDIGIFPVIECIKARDKRMEECGGRWFGDYETPTILSKCGKQKEKENLPLNCERYGRKESEGCDYNEDTNFGKLQRIPYKPLQDFLKKHTSRSRSKKSLLDDACSLEDE